VKVVEINNVQKNGTHIAFLIDAWLSTSACAQATSTPTQQASFTTGHAAGAGATTPRVLGTVNLTDRHQVALMSAFTWFKQAVKVAVGAAAFVAILTLTLGAIGVIVEGGGAALTAAAQTALAGCIGYAAATLLFGRLLFPDKTSTTKDRISAAVAGCIAGAAGGVAIGKVFGRPLATLMRRRLNTTPAILGDSDMAAANQAGVDVTGLADLVDGVADGGLRAAQ
jgi:hypothetical protein